ncbi:hypothetical protein PR048_008527 [Dryococelus australis]|uniref:MADF domain-containing protein n=1 Tax=Dryococelus australis TaxID=614101 RepID=A0ABQ9HXD2_9NEOP|nr:hypothetical protein PR048_008527 [Dryococelus australis]
MSQVPEEEEIMIVELFQCWKQYVCLWDMQNDNYANRDRRNEAYLSLLEIYKNYNCSAEWMEKMRSTYKREARKTKRTVAKEYIGNDAIRSRWWGRRRTTHHKRVFYTGLVVASPGFVGACVGQGPDKDGREIRSYRCRRRSIQDNIQNTRGEIMLVAGTRQHEPPGTKQALRNFATRRKADQNKSYGTSDDSRCGKRYIRKQKLSKGTQATLFPNHEVIDLTITDSAFSLLEHDMTVIPGHLWVSKLESTHTWCLFTDTVTGNGRGVAVSIRAGGLEEVGQYHGRRALQTSSRRVYSGRRSGTQVQLLRACRMPSTRQRYTTSAGFMIDSDVNNEKVIELTTSRRQALDRSPVNWSRDRPTDGRLTDATDGCESTFRSGQARLDIRPPLRPCLRVTIIPLQQHNSKNVVLSLMTSLPTRCLAQLPTKSVPSILPRINSNEALTKSSIAALLLVAQPKKTIELSA